ncbi:MAG TPA: hypothetical protein DIT04_13305, partial [Dysgonomonas sp.]|nr:hypothetical protein [Dysgonomonas sp.]
MKKILFLIIVLFFSHSHIIKSQSFSNKEKISILVSELKNETADSMKVKKLLSLAELYPDTSHVRLKYAETALKIAQKADYKEGIALSYYYLAWYYVFESDHAKSTRSFLKVVEYTNNPEILIDSYGFLSNVNSWNRTHDGAFKWANKAMATAEKSNFSLHKAKAYIYLGDAYRYAGQREEANGCYFKAIKLLRENDRPGNSLLEIVYLHTLEEGVAD